MKHRKTELDVDFIGGMGPLTEEDKKAISDFIKKDKLRRAKREKRQQAARTRSRKTTKSN